jgi:starch synthase
MPGLAALVEVPSRASIFVCPSVQEPMGIVTLGATACATAVVASPVGGIPEVVEDGVTGGLDGYDPPDTDRFAAGVRGGVNSLLADPQLAALMGRAARVHAVQEVSWRTAARCTVEV